MTNSSELPPSSYQSGWQQFPRWLTSGFMMGTTDLVPGVSGGTIALVVGIYPQLVRSLQLIGGGAGCWLRADWSGGRSRLAKVDWRFLSTVLVGIILAVLALSQFIDFLLDDFPIPLAGFFFGLVLASVLVVGRTVEWNFPRISLTLTVAVVLAILLGSRGSTTTDTVTQIGDPSLWAFFGGGALAICAMILPGISGSLLLVLIGMYSPVLDALTNREWVHLLWFILGIGIGLAIFSQILGWVLHRFYYQLLATLLGLMVGSLRLLWPWPGGITDPTWSFNATYLGVTIVVGLAGALLVVGVSRYTTSRI